MSKAVKLRWERLRIGVVAVLFLLELSPYSWRKNPKHLPAIREQDLESREPARWRNCNSTSGLARYIVATTTRHGSYLVKKQRLGRFRFPLIALRRALWTLVSKARLRRWPELHHNRRVPIDHSTEVMQPIRIFSVHACLLSSVCIPVWVCLHLSLHMFLHACMCLLCSSGCITIGQCISYLSTRHRVSACINASVCVCAYMYIPACVRADLPASPCTNVYPRVSSPLSG